MGADSGGQTRMEAAKEAIASLVRAELGLSTRELVAEALAWARSA